MKQLKFGAAALTWFAVAVVVLAPVPAAAQADITGAWIATVDSPQGQASFDVTFKQAGEKLTGEVTSPMGSVDFAGTLVKNDLLITYSIPVQGQNLELKMTGVVDKDTMSGSLDFGGLGQAAWTAKRKPAAEAAAAPAAAAAKSTPTMTATPGGVSGKWNIVVQMGANALPMTATLKQEGEAVSGAINTPLGELPVAGTMTGTNLTLNFTAQTPQGDIAVTMTGQLGPEGLSGKSSVAGLGESDWSGKRVE